jgi:hypothetical protein
MIPESSRVVIASKAGRLGNRLFLSAYFMANALAHGYRLYNPVLGEYAECFEGSKGDPLCRFPESIQSLDPEFANQCRDVASRAVEIWPGALKALVVDIRQTYDARDEAYDLNGRDFQRRIEQGGIVFVKGWKFRDDHNLLRYWNQISAYFRPVKRLAAEAERIICLARNVADHVVGVHVRQGDYRMWKNGIHYFETFQYAHWMRQILSLEKDRRIAFVICSGDLIGMDAFNGLPCVMGPGDAVGDLHVLSLCDAILAPPSTFSTWASFSGRVPLCMLQNHQQTIAFESFVMHDRA